MAIKNGVRKSTSAQPSLVARRAFDATAPRPFANILHPEWSSAQDEWTKWRLTYEGGDQYIETFLRKFKREKWQDWFERKFLTYCPPDAKEAVNEVLNAIFQRLNDVTRVGSDSYVSACKGLNGGVDRAGSTMTAFIGDEILPEMLPMKEVGVWVDMPAIAANATKADTQGVRPYLYTYPIEAIRSWAYDDENKLTSVLLREVEYPLDPTTGLPTSDGDIEMFRFAQIEVIDGRQQVRVTIQNDHGDVTSNAIIDIPEIPFEIFCIKHSLLQDVADMQKALLNMHSADVYWCVKAGFPIYIEQRDSRAGAFRPAQQAPKGPGYPNTTAPFAVVANDIPSGQAKEASEGKDNERTLGVTSGVAYGKDLDPPAFIHPSSEPLKATMSKEQQIEDKIRRAVHLSVAMLDPKLASAESKQMDNEGLQNGLLAIGQALEKGERRIAHIWSLYLKEATATVRYPEQWSGQSDGSRREDAKALCELKDEVPSILAAKEICKQAADKLVGHKVAPEVMDRIHAQIDDAKFLTLNIDDLQKELELGIASGATASVNRGYPATEHEKALKERAETLKIMAISQSAGGGVGAAGDPARGGQGSPTDTKSKDEKALDANKGGQNTDNTRGGAK